jgi:hypothetical protein
LAIAACLSMAGCSGLKELRVRNWAAFPIDPKHVDAVVLTHAHLDHCGYLPRLVAGGFRGRIFCTAGTRDLCTLILPDLRTFKKRTPASPTVAASPSTRPRCRSTPSSMPRARSPSFSRSATSGCSRRSRSGRRVPQRGPPARFRYE